MNPTQYIMKEKECFYLDLNKQPAHHMLRSCVSKESELEYPCSMNKPQLMGDNLILERGSIEHNILSSNVTEGFATDNGPGESNVPMGQCPEGYKRCSISGKCIQVCVNCKYRDGYKSQYMNEFDPCFPEGIYNGRNNQGEILCTCGSKNQYCNYSPEIQRKRTNLYTTDGSLFTDTRIKSTLGNPKEVSKLFLFDNL